MEEDSITVGRMPDVEDRDVLRDLYDASYRGLVGQLYGVTGDLDEAELVVQEAFVRAVAAERRFRRARDPEAWLCATALRIHRSRWRKAAIGPRARERVLTGIVPSDLDDLICRGVRRRMRRRTGLAAAAYGLAAVAGAVALVADDVSPPSPASAPLALRAGLPEVEEVGDRIPPGRAGMPSAVSGAPAAVSVVVPADGPWRENSSGSGIHSAIRGGTAWLNLATYVVDGVVREPCRSSWVPVSPAIPSGFVRPGPTPTALADAIADLPRADVVVSPHLVARWGTTAVHVRVRIPHAGCRNGKLLWTFDTRRGGEFLGNASARLDFWVVELGGRAVVVEAEQPMGATATERRGLVGLLDSVELHDRESQ